MPDMTEAELDKLRSDNENMRDKIAAAQAKKAENDAAVNRNIVGEQLKAENTRLAAQLAAANEAAKITVVRAGAESVLDSVQDQAKQAELLAAQSVGPVDTNADAKKDGGNS